MRGRARVVTRYRGRAAAFEVPPEPGVRRVELPHEVLRLAERGRGLRDAGDLVRVPVDLVLGLDAGLLSLRTLCGPRLSAA